MDGMNGLIVPLYTGYTSYPLIITLIKSLYKNSKKGYLLPLLSRQQFIATHKGEKKLNFFAPIVSKQLTL